MGKSIQTISTKTDPDHIILVENGRLVRVLKGKKPLKELINRALDANTDLTPTRRTELKRRYKTD